MRTTLWGHSEVKALFVSLDRLSRVTYRKTFVRFTVHVWARPKRWGSSTQTRPTGIWREIGDSQLFTCSAMAYAIYAHVAGSSDEVVSVVPAALQGFEAPCNEKYGRQNLTKWWRWASRDGGELCTLFDCKSASACDSMLPKTERETELIESKWCIDRYIFAQVSICRNYPYLIERSPTVCSILLDGHFSTSNVPTFAFSLTFVNSSCKPQVNHLSRNDFQCLWVGFFELFFFRRWFLNLSRAKES